MNWLSEKEYDTILQSSFLHGSKAYEILGVRDIRELTTERVAALFYGLQSRVFFSEMSSIKLSLSTLRERIPAHYDIPEKPSPRVAKELLELYLQAEEAGDSSAANHLFYAVRFCFPTSHARLPDEMMAREKAGIAKRQQERNRGINILHDLVSVPEIPSPSFSVDDWTDKELLEANLHASDDPINAPGILELEALDPEVLGQMLQKIVRALCAQKGGLDPTRGRRLVRQIDAVLLYGPNEHRESLRGELEDILLGRHTILIRSFFDSLDRA